MDSRTIVDLFHANKSLRIHQTGESSGRSSRNDHSAKALPEQMFVIGQVKSDSLNLKPAGLKC